MAKTRRHRIVYRDSKTGQFISKKQAERRPATTERESIPVSRGVHDVQIYPKRVAAREPGLRIYSKKFATRDPRPRPDPWPGPGLER